MNEEMISSAELSRAACCNLGESFVTNPSVDVSYSDAATGAKQIKLLGLSGTYVQMLTENIPNYRGAASPCRSGICPRSVDAKHTGFQRNLISEEWLRSHHGTD